MFLIRFFVTTVNKTNLFKVLNFISMPVKIILKESKNKFQINIFLNLKYLNDLFPTKKKLKDGSEISSTSTGTSYERVKYNSMIPFI